MEIVAIVLSIISLVASTVLTVWNVFTSIKLNKVNLKFGVCEKIFDEYLITKIPQARKYVQFDGKNIFIGGNMLQEVLQWMLQDALYFNYADKVFYKNLKDEIEKLEDYIVLKIDKKFSSIDQSEIYDHIDSSIKTIYKLIESKKVRGWFDEIPKTVQFY